jgi:hypothetical protein
MSRWRRLLFAVLVLLGAAVGAAQRTMAQVITEFPVPTTPLLSEGHCCGAGWRPLVHRTGRQQDWAHHDLWSDYRILGWRHWWTCPGFVER